MFRYGNILILHIKNLVYSNKFVDKEEVEKRMKNTYYDKILQ